MAIEWEGAPHRAWKDTKAWLPSSFIAWTILAVIPIGAGVLTATVIAPGFTGIQQIIYGAIGSLATLVLVISSTFLVHLVLALRRQRNEARQQYTDLHKSVEFLKNIRSGDEITDKEIDVPSLFKHHRLLNNVTFSHCELAGPSVILFLGNTEIGGCGFVGNQLDELFIKADLGRRYVGVGGLANCRFLNCTFKNLGFIVDEQTIENLKRAIIQT